MASRAYGGLPQWLSGKESVCNAGGTGNSSSIPGSGKIPWRKAWQPTPSALAWRIPWTEESGGLQSMGSHRVGHDWSNLACMHALVKEMATHCSILASRVPGTEEPDGLPPVGSHRVGHDWCNLAAAAAAPALSHSVISDFSQHHGL